MSLDLTRRLTPNFTVGELIHSATAEARQLANIPTDAQLKNIEALAVHVLQPVRDHFGRTVINSCFRSSRVNAAVGGSSTSQHKADGKAAAADLECPPHSNMKVAQWIRDNLEFDQLILEHFEKGNPASGWVHVSYVREGRNRRQVMTIQKGMRARVGLG